MNFHGWIFFSVACLTVCFQVGCYSYPPYGTYPNGYPPTGVVQPPGAAYMPPAVPASQAPIATTPNGHGQAQTWQMPEPAVSLGQNSSSDPLYDSSKDSTQPTPAKAGEVPVYPDPNEFQQPTPAGKSDFGGSSDFPGNNTQQKPDSVDFNPFGPSGQTTDEFSGEDVALNVAAPPTLETVAKAEVSDEFVPPIEIASTGKDPAAQSSAIQLTSAVDQMAEPNPYDYDRAQFTWLRGVVDFDEIAGEWSIIYSLRPEADDEFGGSLTLARSQLLSGLQNGDVVLVEGRVDRQTQDHLGKPSYLARHLARLKPKAN